MPPVRFGVNSRLFDAKARAIPRRGDFCDGKRLLEDSSSGPAAAKEARVRAIRLSPHCVKPHCVNTIGEMRKALDLVANTARRHAPQAESA
jgi:hypothetical protein